MPVFTSSIEVTADYPTIKPSLNLNFARARALDPRITFTRASVGTYVGRDGRIKTAGNNEARFDHDPVTLESLGLLIEESRTNIVYGGPGQSNLVVTSGQANSLTGSNDAYKLAKNTPSSNSQSHGGWSINGNVSTTSYIMSVFVKKINHSKFFLQTTVASADNLYVYVDIDTGVTSHTDYTASGNLTVTTSIETYTDGWYRIICRVEGSATNTINSGFRFGFGDPTSGSQQYANGDDEVLVYGAQIEDGSFATSYIPSVDSSSSVTRQADSPYIDGESFDEFYNQSEGTIVSSHSILEGISATHNLYTYQVAPDSGTAEAPFRLLDRNGAYGNTLVATSINSSANVCFFKASGDPVTVANTKMKVAFAIKKNDFAVSFNGTATQTDTAGLVSGDNDHLSIGYYKPSPQAYLNGHIQRLTYYPKRLTDAQLQQLSS